MRPPELSAAQRTIALSALAIVALVTADVAVGGYLTHVDDQLRDALHPETTSAPWLLDALGALGDLRIATPVLAVSTIIACQYTWRMWPAIFAVSTFGSVELAALALKAAVGRPGPGGWAERAGYPGYFPSGHAATASALIAVVAYLAARAGSAAARGRRLPEACLTSGLAVGLLSGTRAVLGDTHWATDVVGGLALTAAVVLPAMVWCGQFLDDRDPAAVAR